MNKLTKNNIYQTAISFCNEMNKTPIPELVGVTDGKAIGTYVEHSFKKYLRKGFVFSQGNSAHGIDLPGELINCDIKVTYIHQPQSSCSYKSGSQKIFGLGYNLLIFVYDRNKEGLIPLKFLNVTFIDEEETGDFTITKRLIEIVKDGGNKEDIISYFQDRNIPGDEIQYSKWADDVLAGKVKQGYLTISNALQWRLQYSRVISLGNSIKGIKNYDFNEKK